MRATTILLLASLVLGGNEGAIAQGSQCAGLMAVYARDVDTMERACRVGPQPPRYHSCNDMRSHVRIMSQNILRCPGISQSLRELAETNARRLAGAKADRRGPSDEQSDYMGCLSSIGTQCMAQCSGNPTCYSACNGSNAWRCR